MNNLEPFGVGLLSRCLYFYQVKKQIGKLILKRTSESNRKKKGFTLNNAQNVAILSFIETEQDHSTLIQNILNLRGEHGVKKVQGIAFVNFAIKKRPAFLTENKDVSFFFKNDLNWKYLPEGETLKLCKLKYDLLLDTFGRESIPLEYLWRKIPASLKVSHERYPTAKFSDLLADGESLNPKVVFKAYEELLTKYDLK